MADVETRRDDADGPQVEQAGHAQAASAAAVCARCGCGVHDVYYEVDGATTCERCRHDMMLAQSDGGGFSRLARAVLFGFVAAVVSSLLWYGISKLTGYEFGVLAIGVGVLVGGAVRAGSRRRGGRRYQALAMWLTYSAIVVTYIPAIVEGVKTATPADSAEVSTSEPARDPAATTATATEASTPQPAELDAGSTAAGDTDGPTGLAGLLLGLGLLLLIAYAAPFIAVAVDVQAVVGLVILAIALYEAWKMNRRRIPEITGPHRIGHLQAAGASGV
jgi:hypothetical protein